MPDRECVSPRALALAAQRSFCRYIVGRYRFSPEHRATRGTEKRISSRDRRMLSSYFLPRTTAKDLPSCSSSCVARRRTGFLFRFLVPSTERFLFCCLLTFCWSRDQTPVWVLDTRHYRRLFVIPARVICFLRFPVRYPTGGRAGKLRRGDIPVLSETSPKRTCASWAVADNEGKK